ncbi:MAG TPA: hypothetical protein VFV50_01995 [Bdellovibrionales bacterium]|nr:hypothetical protein [Bdellovibrionales bacterium]
MAKLLLSLVMLLGTATAFATDLDATAFAKRFELVRNAQGGVQMIALKKGDVQFSIQQIVDDMRKDLEFAQMQNLAANPQFDIVMNEMNGGPDWQQNWKPEQREMAQRSYRELMKVDIAAVFENPKFKDVMKRFESKVKEHLMGHRVMAHLNDSKYFYSRNVAKQLANFGFNLARKYLDNVPLVNIATAIINEAIVNIEERRIFHQNMILFYLERFEPAQLGMTKDEFMYAKSSVYESRIPWFLFPESKKAQAMWRYYGSDYFGFYQLQCDNRLEANTKNYLEVGERLCFAFSVVNEKGQKKIVNLMDSRWLLSSKPADAYIFSEPHKIERQRRLIRLVQMGVQFVPVPSFVRSAFNTFVNSMYVNQEKTEGALHGYFEAAGLRDEANTVVRQALNPFLSQDLSVPAGPNALLSADWL